MLTFWEEIEKSLPHEEVTQILKMGGSSSLYVGNANNLLKSSLPAMRYAMQIMLSGFR